MQKEINREEAETRESNGKGIAKEGETGKRRGDALETVQMERVR